MILSDLFKKHKEIRKAIGKMIHACEVINRCYYIFAELIIIIICKYIFILKLHNNEHLEAKYKTLLVV